MKKKLWLRHRRYINGPLGWGAEIAAVECLWSLSAQLAICVERNVEQRRERGGGRRDKNVERLLKVHQTFNLCSSHNVWIVCTYHLINGVQLVAMSERRRTLDDKHATLIISVSELWAAYKLMHLQLRMIFLHCATRWYECAICIQWSYWLYEYDSMYILPVARERGKNKIKFIWSHSEVTCHFNRIHNNDVCMCVCASMRCDSTINKWMNGANCEWITRLFIVVGICVFIYRAHLRAQFGLIERMLLQIVIIIVTTLLLRHIHLATIRYI